MPELVQACAAAVQRGDPDRFLSAMSAPVDQRGSLLVLYAFNLEIVRAPWVTKEALIAEMRLQWWLDAIDEIYAGQIPKGHQVVTPLADVIKQHSLPKELFQQLISARKWDIYADPHADAFAFEDYMRATAGNLMALCACTLGGCDLDKAIEFGYGDGIARLFRAIPALENAQKTPLIDGRGVAIARLAKRALGALDAGASRDRRVFPAYRAAWMARPVLRRVLKDPASVSTDDLHFSPFGTKMRLISKVFLGRY
ncbi:phytoene synthase [Amylibacter marinus]|uniref:Phytoene synthase n=1 Tax=Amylibacter marinus TaxID=1475483 RepID=A0ABQ5VS47_9RHOB|nr:squalene/phytoene synthase family protein [Amylibacter marinus]GLQ34019.1 phytoene synthase [Amylibacter marinus]